MNTAEGGISELSVTKMLYNYWTKTQDGTQR